MSDLIANDAALETLRERVRQFDAELADLATQTKVASAGRELLLDLIATLSRKPRVRRPRAVDAPDAAQDDPAVQPAADPMAAFRGEAA